MEGLLFLPPNLTDAQSHDVYQKFIDFYLNGREVLSLRNAYQLAEVSAGKGL
jgi:hypothetical protein